MSFQGDLLIMQIDILLCPPVRVLNLLQVLVEDALPGASVEMGGSGNHASRSRIDGLVGKRGHSILAKMGLPKGLL